MFASASVASSDFIGELCGRLELHSAFPPSLSSSVWYHKTIDMVVDARYVAGTFPAMHVTLHSKMGNLTRYLRRSCQPNADVRDMHRSGLRVVAVFATQDIHEVLVHVWPLYFITAQGTEITIPFDYPVERARGCGCSLPNCKGSCHCLSCHIATHAQCGLQLRTDGRPSAAETSMRLSGLARPRRPVPSDVRPTRSKQRSRRIRPRSGCSAMRACGDGGR